MNIAEQSFAPEFAVVEEVFRAHASEFASRGFTLLGVTEGTPLVRSIDFSFSNPREGLLLDVSFFVGRSGLRRGFIALMCNRDNRKLNVKDYLKLHGRSDVAALFTCDDPSRDLREFAESTVRILLGLLDNELRPIVEGRTFEETPIDWQGYK